MPTVTFSKPDSVTVIGEKSHSLHASHVRFRNAVGGIPGTEYDLSGQPSTFLQTVSVVAVFGACWYAAGPTQQSSVVSQP
jgi:hypothetical protein